MCIYIYIYIYIYINTHTHTHTHTHRERDRERLGIEGTYLNIIMAIYNKSTASITLSGEKYNRFPVRLEISMATLMTPIQYSID